MKRTMKRAEMLPLSYFTPKPQLQSTIIRIMILQNVSLTSFTEEAGCNKSIIKLICVLLLKLYKATPAILFKNVPNS